MVVDYLGWPLSCCALAIAVVACWVAWKWHLQPDYSNMPPSPPTFPIIGNIYLILKSKFFYKLADVIIADVGDIFTLWMFSQPVVFIADCALAREAFVESGRSTSNRIADSTVIDMATRSYKGILFHPFNKHFVRNRKICTNALRDLMSNKNAASAKMLDNECRLLVRNLLEAGANDRAFDAAGFFSETTSRIMGGACFGESFTKKQGSLGRIQRISELATKTMLVRNFFLLTSLPMLRYLPLFGLDSLTHYIQERDNLISEEFKSHRDTLKDAAAPRDVIDVVISAPDLTEDDGFMLINDLLLGGSTTVNVTMEWAMLCLVVHPEWQLKLQNEVDAVIGSGTDLSSVDTHSIPLIRAFYSEVLRWSSCVPAPVMHATSSDITLKGYNIPKGTNLTILFPAINKDETHWDEPQLFNPSRFINSDGDFFTPTKSYMPFSVGPRICPGEGFAKREMFFMLLYIVYYLNIRSHADGQLPSIEAVECSTLDPEPYMVRVHPRRPFEDSLEF